jgi:hypothetical protein
MLDILCRRRGSGACDKNRSGRLRPLGLTALSLSSEDHGSIPGRI